MVALTFTQPLNVYVNFQIVQLFKSDQCKYWVGISALLGDSFNNSRGSFKVFGLLKISIWCSSSH